MEWVEICDSYLVNFILNFYVGLWVFLINICRYIFRRILVSYDRFFCFVIDLCKIF